MTVVSRAAALLILSALFVALAGGKPSMAQTAQATARYLKLADHLDRPADGYCLDVPGAGGRFRLDKPLTVHNCKPGRAPDGVVVHRDDGTLWFPAFDLCVTAMGTNRGALPGSAPHAETLRRDRCLRRRPVAQAVRLPARRQAVARWLRSLPRRRRALLGDLQRIASLADALSRHLRDRTHRALAMGPDRAAPLNRIAAPARRPFPGCRDASIDLQASICPTFFYLPTI